MRPKMMTLALAVVLSATPVLETLAENTPPRLRNPSLIEYPWGLANLHGIYNGYAVIRFHVDADGNPSDFICIETNHPGLGDVAIAGIQRSGLRPAMENNQPTEVITTLRVDFMPGGGAAVEVSSLDHKIASPRDLDEPLRFRVEPVPFVAVDDEGNPFSGEARVEFFIDRDGSVKLPRVLSATNEHVAQVAMRTVREFQFAPPLRRGKPVPVRVVQPFRFGNP